MHVSVSYVYVSPERSKQGISILYVQYFGLLEVAIIFIGLNTAMSYEKYL